MNFTFGIFTHNEGRKYIDICLSHILEAKQEGDEIILLDDYSTDEDTIAYLNEISEKVKVLKRHLNGNFAVHKNFLLSQATKDWILLFDADEYMELETLNRIRAIVESCPEDIDGFNVPRLNRIIGLDMSYVAKMHWTCPIIYGDYAINYPDYQIRLFRNRREIKYHNAIHEIPVGYKNAKFLSTNSMLEFIHIKTQERQERQNKLYAEIDAEYYKSRNISL